MADQQDPKYIKDLSEARAKDPKKFDADKAKYDAAVKQDSETGRSTMDMLKDLGKSIIGKKKGGCVKMAKGGSASSRGDGCAQRGKTKGKMV